MRSENLADKAWADMGEAEDKGSPFGGGSDELEAQMEKFLAAAAKKDTRAMAEAFQGAMDACE